jgi:large subunit ribosomal protein L10
VFPTDREACQAGRSNPHLTLGRRIETRFSTVGIIHSIFMPKTRARKTEEIDALKDRLSRAKSVVFVNHQGLRVKEATELRNVLRASDVELTVAKRTLLRKAMAGTAHEGVDLKQFEGGLGLAFGFGDEGVPAKVLSTFAKTHPTLALVGGLLGERVLSKADVIALSKLPGQQELRGQLVSVIAAPLRGLVTAMAGPARGLVTALSALADQRANSSSTH